MTVFAKPGADGSVMSYESRYDNWIGGQWTPAGEGPVLREPVAGGRQDVLRGRALDRRGHRPRPRRRPQGRSRVGQDPPVAERSLALLRIADRMEENLEKLAVAETWDNGKAVRETLAADIPLAIDHFRYFAGALRAQQGGISEIDEDTVAYHFHEPLGVVGQIIPWNFPILMAVWKLAPPLSPPATRWCSSPPSRPPRRRSSTW